MAEFSYPKHKIRIALFESIHPASIDALKTAGYSVDLFPKALEGEALTRAVADAHVIGVRSRTKIRQEQIAAATRLLCIGCFSVGTDQVSLDDASRHGIPVFNAPHSSTRSVAELTLGNIITLARRTGDKNLKMHAGRWDKSLGGAHEVRGKTLGLVGYGHIGQQVGILAEAFGLRVSFHDVLKKLPLGLARAAASLDELLADSDFVSVHVPDTEHTRNLIDTDALARMKPGSYLLNMSRGSVVDLQALKGALQSGHLGGASVDVFPVEPTPADSPFECGLEGLPNVLLSPHIGGNTEEAQKNIGLEVADAFIDFIDRGSTQGAVNFPTVSLPVYPGSHRILNIHRNMPGVLAEVTRIVSEVGANIDAQMLSTRRDVGYLIMDINKDLSEEVRSRIEAMPANIKTRILF